MLGAIEHPMGATQKNDRFQDASGPSQQGGYLGQLKRELGIVGGQGRAWEGFASSLRANARRMSAARDMASKSADECALAFGDLPHRLSDLAAMQLAAADLLAVLTPAQRRRAAQLLPLCCLPAAGRG